MTTLDAIIPVHVSDIARFKMLQMSLLKYYPDLGNVFVVVPRDHVAAFAAVCKLPRCSVLPEEEVVPEFADPATCPNHSGWWKQQFIKLAGSNIVSSDYYFTFDADMLCSKYITDDDVFVNGKATVKRYTGSHYAEWYDWVVKVLKIEGPWPYRYSLTPTPIHRDAVRSLASHLEMVSGLPWLTYLCQAHPWTEYALYFTYLDYAGMFDKYYHNGSELYGNCVWVKEQFANWNPELSFGHYPFTVVQSNTEIPAEAVFNKVCKYITPIDVIMN